MDADEEIDSILYIAREVSGIQFLLRFLCAHILMGIFRRTFIPLQSTGSLLSTSTKDIVQMIGEI